MKYVISSLCVIHRGNVKNHLFFDIIGGLQLYMVSEVSIGENITEIQYIKFNSDLTDFIYVADFKYELPTKLIQSHATDLSIEINKYVDKFVFELILALC